jgi:hypothetical protein
MKSGRWRAALLNFFSKTGKNIDRVVDFNILGVAARWYGGLDLGVGGELQAGLETRE